MTDASTDRQLAWYAALLRRADGLREGFVGAVVADVGAHVGALSEGFASAVGREGRVISIEPLRSNVGRIEARIAAGGHAHWSVRSVAISDHAGTLALRVARFDDGWSSAVAGVRDGGAVRIEVPCLRLVDAVPDATVVKLDIEGHEYAVLDDALEAMPGVCAWLLELHMLVDGSRPLQGVIGRLRRAGFDVRAAGRSAGDPHGPWRAVPIDERLDWSQIPWAQARAAQGQGAPGSVKSLHVVALRER
ncbi:MAG: FkbM family methyltransferase [Deltaproteobacteria bacterium]|nr:FkbM family methyltransferase [Deltaproteobacteria bacterium]